MKTNNEILNELKELSPVLAAIPRKNCFITPADYFSDAVYDNSEAHLAEERISSLKNEKSFLLPVSLNTDDIFHGVIANVISSRFPESKNIFTTPINYFVDLTERILNLLKEEPSLELPAERFKVPENYFDSLSDVILSKIEMETGSEEEKLNPLFEQMRHEEIFLVPENYFSQLSDSIIESQITIDTEEKIEKYVGKENPFTTPIAYFDGLSSRLSRKLKKEASAKWFSPVLTLSIITLFFIASLFIFNSFDDQNNFDNQLANLTVEELEQFIAENEFDFDEYMFTEINGEEIENSLLYDLDISEEELDYYLYDIDENLINNL